MMNYYRCYHTNGRKYRKNDVDINNGWLHTRNIEVQPFLDSVLYRMLTKIFHAEIVVDNEKVKRETANYKKLPQIIDFRDEDEDDRMEEEIQANYNRVKQEVQQIVTDEMERIKNDPDLQHLLKTEN